LSPRLNLIEDYFTKDQVGYRRGTTSEDLSGIPVTLKTSISAAPSPRPNSTSDILVVVPESYDVSFFSIHQKEAGDTSATRKSPVEVSDCSQRHRKCTHRRVRRGRIFRRRRAMFSDRRRAPTLKKCKGSIPQLPPLPPPLAPWARPIIELLQAHLNHLGDDIPESIDHLDDLGVWGGPF
jgi:hypothetical protein